MSAIEVIEQIKQLPREEPRKVAAFMNAMGERERITRPEPKVSGEFRRVADEVLKTNAEPFRKLAS